MAARDVDSKVSAYLPKQTRSSVYKRLTDPNPFQISIPSSPSSKVDPLHNLAMPLAAARKTVTGPYLRLIDGNCEPMEGKLAAPLTI